MKTKKLLRWQKSGSLPHNRDFPEMRYVKQDVLLKGLICCLMAVTFLACGSKITSKTMASNPVKKIVFLGNSITYSGQYVADIETYHLIKHPEVEAEWINLGLPSETVSGLSEEGHADGEFPRPSLHERLQRVLHQIKPDMVFASYGMNDGIYLPFDQERFEKFKLGMIRLHDEVVSSGAEIIHLTPPVYDDLKGGKTGYDRVLDEYSQWLLARGSTNNWRVVDIHGPMKSYLVEKRKADPSFSLASDGVHPGDEGHWVMTKEILKYLGETEVAQAKGLEEAIGSQPNSQQIQSTVREKQQLMRDAWLTATGHQRPGLKKGLPIKKATARAKSLDEKIDRWLKSK